MFQVLFYHSDWVRNSPQKGCGLDTEHQEVQVQAGKDMRLQAPWGNARHMNVTLKMLALAQWSA